EQRERGHRVTLTTGDDGASGRGTAARFAAFAAGFAANGAVLPVCSAHQRPFRNSLRTGNFSRFNRETATAPCHGRLAVCCFCRKSAAKSPMRSTSARKGV